MIVVRFRLGTVGAVVGHVRSTSTTYSTFADLRNIWIYDVLDPRYCSTIVQIYEADLQSRIDSERRSTSSADLRGIKGLAPLSGYVERLAAWCCKERCVTKHNDLLRICAWAIHPPIHPSAVMFLALRQKALRGFAVTPFTMRRTVHTYRTC